MNDHRFGKEPFIRFTVRVFRERFYAPTMNGGRAYRVYPVRICVCVPESCPGHNIGVHEGI